MNLSFGLIRDPQRTWSKINADLTDIPHLTQTFRRQLPRRAKGRNQLLASSVTVLHASWGELEDCAATTTVDAALVTVAEDSGPVKRAVHVYQTVWTAA